MFGRRLAALAVSLTLLMGQFAWCAGWEATPEARMACCSDGDSCPMHASEPSASPSQRVVTQADADSCCATAERGDASPGAPTAASMMWLDVVLSPVDAVAAIAQPAPIASWQDQDPPLPSRVSRHLLLSVLLV